MPSNQAPTVFVSSTCYDLAELRDDLKEFLEEHLGYDAMLSEYSSFPIDPLSSPVSNCRTNVMERADILVLVVGKRYGTIDKSGTSITNLEYQQAKAKGIPIYVFIDRTILDLLPVWKRNPKAKFDNIDNVQLFAFVDEIRNSGCWSYSFSKASEIVTTLRHQFACLFLDSLGVWRRTRNAGLGPTARQLQGEALRLVIEKPDYWEYLLNLQVLEDEIAALGPAKRDAEIGIISGRCEYLPFDKSQHGQVRSSRSLFT